MTTRPGEPPSSRALARFFPIADAIAALLQPFAEIVVHDLGTETVAYLANNFSKRSIGDPALLHEIDFDPETPVIGPYEKTNWDGRRIKSISVVLRDDSERAVAVLCMNVDVTEFAAARQVLERLVGNATSAEQPASLFRDDWHEKINRFVAAWTAERSTTLERLSRAERKALVEALHDGGAFEGKHAAAYVARVVGVSRASVYSYISDKRDRRS